MNIMRQIKFRGKRTDTGEWVEGDLIHRDAAPKSISNIQIAGYGVQPETVGQFTELFDKNGKEIFEGDVVSFRGDQYSVKMIEGGCYMLFHHGDFKAFGLIRCNGECEIIGNIYDTSE